MCLVTEHARLKRQFINLESDYKKLEAKLAERQATLEEYQEMLETGWKYPDTTLELPSARDIITNSQIRFTANTLTIKDLPSGLWIADLADTNSEEPFMDIGHNPLLIPLPQPSAPYRYEDLAIGDICVYSPGSNQLIIHRIVDIKTDGQGRLYTFRGDNTAIADPYTIRDSNIQYLMIGVVF